METNKNGHGDVAAATSGTSEACIKPEYIDKSYRRELVLEYVSSSAIKTTSDTKTDDGAKSDDGPAEPPKKKIKLKGRNKKRPIEKRPDDADKLCRQVVNGNVCSFGDRCKYSHKIGEWMDRKPADIADKCYLYETLGKCPYSLTCRYGGQHLTADYKNVVNQELFAQMKDIPSETNSLNFEAQKKLRKRNYDFTKANGVTKAVSKEFKERERVNKNVPGGGAKKGSSPPPVTSDVDSAEVKVNDVGQSEGTTSVTACEPVAGMLKEDASCVATSVPESEATVPKVTVTEHGDPVQIVETKDGINIRQRTCEKTKLDFRDKLYLAPLTTVGNLPFRRLCKRLGVDVTCGEMAMTPNLLQGQPSEWALLKRHVSEDIFGVQLCASYADAMTRCAQLITENISVDFIDINCGCPIDLVFKRGEGSAVMARTGRLEQIIRSLTTYTDLPITMKIRTGIMGDKSIAHTLLPRLRNWGVSMTTLHGRSREQRYTRLADWEYIAECAEAANPMPLFGNGDILSYSDYQHRRDTTGVAGCMIARGALIKPWIFTEIKETRDWDISAGERLDYMRDFVNYGLEHWGSDQQGVATTRRFLLEWLSFTHRYIPVGLLEVLPQKIHDKPPHYFGRSDLETLLSSPSCADWVKISEMLLGPVPDSFSFLPKHKANAFR